MKGRASELQHKTAIGMEDCLSRPFNTLADSTAFPVQQCQVYAHWGPAPIRRAASQFLTCV